MSGMQPGNSGEDRTTILCVHASVCKGMVLRTGLGKVKHLSTKQLWVQGAVQSYAMEGRKVPRAENASDISARPVGEAEMKEGLRRTEYQTPVESLGHPSLVTLLGKPVRQQVLGEARCRLMKV